MIDFYMKLKGVDFTDAVRELAEKNIELAKELKSNTLALMREEGADAVGGIMHCFVEDWETARQALDMNFCISFSGIVTFKNAVSVQEVARQVPLDRLLVETDSPYLAPVPHRGKPNQPAYVRHVAEYLAQLRGMQYEDLARHTTDNFFTLFNTDAKTL